MKPSGQRWSQRVETIRHRQDENVSNIEDWLDSLLAGSMLQIACLRMKYPIT